MNGAAVTQTRQRDYMRSLQKCWFDKDVFQKRFAQCGGTPQQYDSVAVQGETLLRATGVAYTGANGQIPNAAVAGFTADSGVRDQIRNLLACQVSLAIPTTAANEDAREFRVRWRINGTGLFNPLSRGDKVSSSCPYKQSARALPHMNVVSINILFQDLMKSLVRNFSSTLGEAGVNLGANLTMVTGLHNDLKVELAETPDAKLYVEYLRLPSWRVQSGTALLQTFRVAVHDPTTDSAVTGEKGIIRIAAAGVDGTSAIEKVLKCTGIDRYGESAAPFRGVTGGVGNAAAPAYREVQWSGITAAQIPQYLFVVLEKSMDLVCSQSLNVQNIVDFESGNVAITQAIGDHVGRKSVREKIQFAARNSDGNAAITQFHLEIMSVQGSYIYSSGSWPFIKTRGDLYRDVQKYCIDSYDDQDTWFKHNCIVLLGASEFAKGISSPGCAFPCTFSVKARFENWRCYVDGMACKYPHSGGMAALQDFIGGRPVLGMIYPQQSLQVSASSALLSSQNISHASAMELLSRQ